MANDATRSDGWVHGHMEMMPPGFDAYDGNDAAWMAWVVCGPGHMEMMPPEAWVVWDQAIWK